MCSTYCVFSLKLIHFDFGNVRDYEIARIRAIRVVDIHCEVGHLTCHEEVLRHSQLQVRHLTADETDLLLERYEYIELRVANDGPHRAVVDSLSVTYFALTPLIIDYQ